MTTYSAIITEQYRRHVSRANTRRVWAEVTKTPQAGVREIGERLDMEFGSVSVALRILRRAGYIEFNNGERGARTVIVPFVIIERKG